MTIKIDGRGDRVDYKDKYRRYHASPKAKKQRAARNKARRTMGLKKGDPREVDHKRPLASGGSNERKNLRVVSRYANRKRPNP